MIYFGVSFLVHSGNLEFYKSTYTHCTYLERYCTHMYLYVIVYEKFLSGLTSFFFSDWLIFWIFMQNEKGRNRNSRKKAIHSILELLNALKLWNFGHQLYQKRIDLIQLGKNNFSFIIFCILRVSSLPLSNAEDERV